MADREKVINGLECCFNPHSEHSCLCRCADCPYNPPEDDDWNQQCQIELNMDALTLLKEQRPTGKWIVCKASVHPYGYDVKCSVCGHRMGSSFGYKFCPECGADMR